MPELKPVRLPMPDDRTSVIGRTGSGKTQLGVWLLSTQNIDQMPWVIIDYKNDVLINSIEKAEYITFDEIPERPGIYILKVMPGDEEILSDWFRRVLQHENIGIMVDEGYMIGQRDKWFNACLTQGRSKNVPMIVCTQRPMWLSRFVFSESSYFFIFDLTDEDDLTTVKRFVKKDYRKELDKPKAEYHSHYYNVGKPNFREIGPVPDGPTILALIDAKLPKRRHRFI